jgi:hypothetical protein
MAETPPVTYSSLSITMVSPTVSTISYDDPIIESISVDENGNTVTVFYPTTYTGDIGKVDERVVTKDLNAPDILAKFADYTASQNYINENGTFIEYVNVFWDPVEYATGYQVFIIIDGSAAVLFDSLRSPPLLNYKSNGPLFSDQSGILSGDTFNFQFYFKGTLEVSKLHALVFAYSEQTVGRYPVYMITCVAGINKMFVEKTSYWISENNYFTIKDDKEHLPGAEINVAEKNIVAI